MKEYNPSRIEKHWRKVWQKGGIYKTDLKGAKRPFYNLMMYPYPSAEGLHVGNVYAFTGSDIYGRFKRMQGFDVFEPIGFDSGGIHSENFAIQMGIHPKIMVEQNIKNFTRQLKIIGNMFDWEHSLDAMDQAYYQWTQWIFIQLFKAGLAYKKKAPVTWCPSCKTTLADEQTERKCKVQSAKCKVEEVVVCERCKMPVEKREMNQWFLGITRYAERLLKNTEKLDWSEKVLLAQRNWIGKSEGTRIKFKVQSAKCKVAIQNSKLIKNKKFIEVFTTRPDTLYGVTFLALAPDHPFVASLLKLKAKSYKLKAQIEDYIKSVQKKSEIEGLAEDKEKTGVFTGSYVINPVNGEKLPVYVADYVMKEYGGGAVMGVPMHDSRDYAFAKKHRLPLKTVVIPKENSKFKIRSVAKAMERRRQNSKLQFKIQNFKNYSCYEGEGILVNSGPWNGWRYPEDLEKVIAWLEKRPPHKASEGQRKMGRRAVQYKLRDWCISRQRYWGPPIPMIFCPHCAEEGKSWYDTKEAKEHQRKFKIAIQNSKLEKIQLQAKSYKLKASMAGWYPVPEKDLPVLLPETDDYLPSSTGKPPLARLPAFFRVKCPNCGGEARRETDVSDTFLDSSWYFLAYPNVGTKEWKGKKIASLSHCHIVNSEAMKQCNNVTIQPFNSFLTKKWLPVNMYIGGAEHSVLHLLYARFITMALHDLGYLHFEEPFLRFYAHGLIIKDGAKMSKSRGNVVNPDDYIKKYGADCLRAYLMFLGPLSAGGDFRDTGMKGMHRFLKRVWRLGQEKCKVQSAKCKVVIPAFAKATAGKEEAYWGNKTIKKVTEDILRFKYNTALSAIMEYVNYLVQSAKCKVQSLPSKKALETLILLLAPFTPHLSEELWQLSNLTPQKFLMLHSAYPAVFRSGISAGQAMKQCNNVTVKQFKSVHQQPWPEYDSKLAREEMVTIVVQVNGKLRDKLTVRQCDNETMRQLAIRLSKQSQKVSKYLKGKQIKKTIFVPGRLVNFVIE